MANYKHEVADIHKGLRELALREMHPLRVYRPMPQQLPLHEASCSEVLAWGGKRSGKTLAVTMEFGSRILGVPITRADGTKIPLRYPVARKGDAKLYWIIGFNVDHIGQTLYHRLFSPGLGCDFRIIEDEITGQWRAYNRNKDQPRFAESRLSPPMFPDYLIKDGSWHMDSAAGHVVKSVETITDATLAFYASTGDHPKQGDAVHGIFLDEDVVNPDFIKEWQDRLITACGWWLWSIWPHGSNDAFIKAIDRAKEQEDDPNPAIIAINLVGSQNTYNDERGIKEAAARMDDDDDLAHRDRGDFSALLGQFRMYDFAPAVHVINGKETDKPEDCWALLEKILHEQGRFPSDWTRYLAIDPSHTRTACLFGVVPPPDYDNLRLGDRLIVENELIVKRHTPAMFADALKKHVSGLRFEAFIMDQQIGKQTTVGNDRTVFQSYEREFQRIGLYSRQSKHGFLRGCNDKALRRRTVRMMLEPTLDGLPRLLFSGPRTFETQSEIYKYRKKQLKSSSGPPILLDEPVNERQCDAMAALEYLCQFVWERMEQHEAWRGPEQQQARPSGAWLAAQEINKREAQNYVHLGPGAAA